MNQRARTRNLTIRFLCSFIPSKAYSAYGRRKNGNRRLFTVLLVVTVWLQSCQPTSPPETPLNQLAFPTPVTNNTPVAVPSMTSHDATATSMTSPTISESLGITPTLQLSTSPDVPELKAELYAFFGGGGPSCAFGPAQGDSPEIQFLSHSFPAPAQDTILCLYNFPLNAEVTVEMIDPSGHTAEQKIYRVGSQLVKYEYASVQEFSLLEIPISFPLTLTSGAWQVLASSDGAQAEGTFLIGEYDPANPEFRPEAPFVTHSPILPAADITPMNPQLRASYQAGETIRIQGRHFTPNTQFRAGLYQGWMSMSLISSFVVTTDKQGSFTHDLRLDDDLPSGEYSIILPTFLKEDTEDLVSEDVYFIEDYYGRFTVQNGPARPPDWKGCQVETNLVVGGNAYIADNQANNLRQWPGTIYLRVGKLEPGEQVDIIDGPVCADGYIWWDIHSLETNLVGWTAEGEGQESWILPLP